MKLQAVSQAAAYLQRIRDHHCTLTSRQREVLALRASGIEEAQIGDLLGIEDVTVRNHLTLARAKVAPPGLTPQGRLSMTWAYEHSGCCLTEFGAIRRRERPPAGAVGTAIAP
jgi:hypothetical protein